jgi:F-type H+-transporting ATPase subunit b
MTPAEFLSSNTASFLWGLSAFFVFTLILIPMGIKPIIAAIDAREKKLADELKASEEAYARAKKVQADVDAKFAAAESRINELMDKARKDAEALKDQMVDKGRAEIEASRVRSLRDIEAARHNAVIAVRDGIAEIAMVVASKIVESRLDAPKQEELVAHAIDSFEARHNANAGPAGKA